MTSARPKRKSAHMAKYRSLTAAAIGACSFSVHHVKVSIETMRNRPRLFPAAAALVLGLVLSACTYRGGDEDSPIRRSFSWFSYLSADDLRAGCRRGAPDRYRIVYNAVWQEQLRTYDFTIGRGGGDLKIQVKGEADFSRSIPLDDLLSPWRGRTERARVTGADMRHLRRTLRQSGFYKPVPQGMRVQSWGFFWVTAACEGGRFRFNAWAYPSARFDRVRLARVLSHLDGTGIPFNRPRVTWEPDHEEHKDIDRYRLVVKGTGFADNLKLF